MSVAELRRKLKVLHADVGTTNPTKLRKVEVERMIGVYEDVIARRNATPLSKESHHLPPREITETAKTSDGIELPVVPPKRPTQDRKKPTTAKDIVIVHETGAAEAVEVKKAHVKAPKVVKEKAPVEASAEPVEKKKRVMTDEHKAKMKAGLEARKARLLADKGEAPTPAPSAPASAPAPKKETGPPPPAPSAPAKLPSGVRPLA
jgi:hypothetical protein